MKFETFLKERGGSYYTGIRDRKIIDTSHAVERYQQRFDSNPQALEEILDAIRKGMRVILLKHRDNYGSYVIHSKSTQVGVVIEWRKDNKNPNDYNKHAIIVSILPRKPKHFSNNPSDIMLIVEKYNKEISDYTLILVD